MKWNSKSRLIAACFGLVALFIGFGIRLYDLQVVHHYAYTLEAAQEHESRQTIYAQRGGIEDVNGEALAVNEPVKTVVADNSLITNSGALAEILTGPLGIDLATLKKRFANKKRKYVVLKKEVAVSVANDIVQKLQRKHLKGIYFEQNFTRAYPSGSMLSHVLGYMDASNHAVGGIEQTMNRYLQGNDGFRYIVHDRTGRELVPYRGLTSPPRDGNNVRLTVDMNIQNIVETELDAAVKQYKPERAVVIVMRPSTGEILAMASRPNFDPNHVDEIVHDPNFGERMANVAIQAQFEPGSTFKIVATSGALNERVISPNTIINCGNGAFYYCGNTLHDDEPNGDLDLAGILMKSSNIGAAKLALRLGEQRFYDYIRKFGFGDYTGIMLPGEIRGTVNPPYRWSKISITHIPMGQEVSVTPLQTVCAMSAVVNGGRLMMPQIVHDVTDANGRVIARYPPAEVRRVMRPEVAAVIRNDLKDVVSAKGTAPLAAVPGYAVGGKTGTANMPNPKGGYFHSKHVASFVGFLPADHPQFCCIVLLAAPKTEPNAYYGGLVAAPVFSRIAGQIAHYLNLPPDPNLPDGQIVKAHR